MKSLLSTLLLITSVAIARSQDAPAFEVRTNITAVDDKGFAVAGLKKDDFHIFDGGVEQKVTYFSEKKPPVSVELVVDNSGSVREQLDAVIGLTRTIVSNLGDADQTQIVRFVGKQQIQVVQPWTIDKGKLKDAADNLYIEGGLTAVVDALFLAAEEAVKHQKNAPDSRHAIILISDGEDRDSHHKVQDVVGELRGTDIQIFSITLMKDLGKTTGYSDGAFHMSAKDVGRLVTRITSLTGGTSYNFRDTPTAGEIRANLPNLIGELRSEFVIGYQVTQSPDAQVHKLLVTVADGPNSEKRHAVARDSIVIPGSKQ